MKKLLLTLLAVFYLAVASGAGLSMHYCMGELVDWSVYDDQKHACDFCGMEKKDAAASSATDCCKDVQHFAKVDQAQKANAQLFNFEQAPVVLNVLPLYAVVAVSLKKHATPLVWVNAPPKSLQLPIFIKNCTYRI